MSDDNQITYTYRLLNNVSEVAEEIVRDTERAGVSITDLMDKETKIIDVRGNTVKVMEETRTKLISNLQRTSDEVSEISETISRTQTDIQESSEELEPITNETREKISGQFAEIQTDINAVIERISLATVQSEEDVGQIERIIESVDSEIDVITAKMETAVTTMSHELGTVDEELIATANNIIIELENAKATAIQTREESKTVYDAVPFINDTISKQHELTGATERANTTLKSQQEILMQQVVSFMAVGSAVSQVTGGLRQMGIVSDETAKKLQMVNGGFQLINGAITGLKALQLIMKTIQTTEAGTAVIETYRATLKNPYMAVLAGAGIGTAVGVGAMLMSNTNTPNHISNEETVIVNFHTEDQRGYGQDISSVVIR